MRSKSRYLWCSVAVVIAAFSFAPPLQAADSDLPLQTVADIPLTGRTTRFDYESIDQLTHRLYIAHLGDSTVTVFDTEIEKVIADISQVGHVHGLFEQAAGVAAHVEEQRAHALLAHRLEGVGELVAGGLAEGHIQAEFGRHDLTTSLRNPLSDYGNDHDLSRIVLEHHVDFPPFDELTVAESIRLRLESGLIRTIEDFEKFVFRYVPLKHPLNCMFVEGHGMTSEYRLMDDPDDAHEHPRT